MARTTDTGQETVAITNHASERSDGGDKAKCRLPDSVIENVIMQRKGNQYLDREEDSIHFLYNSTVIITNYDPEQHRWAVITIYRDPAARTKRRSSRYEEIDVNTVVKEAQQS